MQSNIDYRAIMRTCLDIIPVIIDIIKIYGVILLAYGGIGFFLFGGIMNSDFIETYNELTGDEIDEETLRFNFNDVFNSFMFFFNINLAGYVENINLLLVVFRSYNSSPL